MTCQNKVQLLSRLPVLLGDLAMGSSLDFVKKLGCFLASLDGSTSVLTSQRSRALSSTKDQESTLSWERGSRETAGRQIDIAPLEEG